MRKLTGMTPNMTVDDMVGTLSWYEDVLGFSLVRQIPDDGIPDWAMMKRDQVAVTFQTRHSLGEEMPDLARLPLGGGLAFYIEVEDVESFCDEIKREIDLAADLHKTFYGTLEFTVRDNNDFVLTFAESIS